MKKKVIYYIIIIGLSLVVLLGYKNRRYVYYLLQKEQANSIELNTSEPVLAVFSFNGDVQNQLISSFSHIKVILTDNGKWEHNDTLLTEFADSIPVMITVETWGGNRTITHYSSPLGKLVKGDYNKAIQSFCKELIGKRSNVYIRFDPEMEVPVKYFPWQFQGPGEYINAFRYFTKQCKLFSPQVKIVWGPAGYPGSMEFYPGDDVVDVTSVTVKSDSEQFLNVYPKNYPDQYDIFRRLHRLRFIDKPVYIIGSKQYMSDSVNWELIYNISNIINKERDVVYSNVNFNQHAFDKAQGNFEKFEIGLYDPQALLNTDEHVTVEHLFVDFGSLDNGKFESEFQKVIKRGHNVIVTFEPFRFPDGKTDLNVLQNITIGRYDREIEHLYSILTQTKARVYLRYAHEMEIPITRYPWQSQNPVDYIHSFRYFMNFMNPFPDNIKRVWGPAGDRGSIEWYPGNDVVDFLSIAIYGLPDKNITDPEKQETFSAIFNRKFWRLRSIDKPLFITEFGVKGPEDYQTKWLEGAARVIRDNPQIAGINYFNMSDTPKAWGDIKPPDWSISAESFHHFIEVLRGDLK
ncbi:hypothetical protein ACE01N_02485 [Saccharicrinis sp. FJH2]|uniref:hypothetical protein n=1 Tax=Saccharicrinis sp. FJH65 TaxID=3344659 RepID=UPI0035F384F2